MPVESTYEESKSTQMPGRSVARDIVLIHGLWMTPLSWEGWKKRFTDHGYNVMTPGWPGVDGKTIEDIRRNPDFMRGLGIEEIVNHYAEFVKSLEHPPIIMGHSFGGLITQLLLNRGLGCAGVAISSAQTKGVMRLPFSTIRVAWGALRNPFNVNGLVDYNFKQFDYAFTNGLGRDVAMNAFKRYYIPGPTRPLIQGGLANFTPDAVSEVDYKNKNRPPLLFIGAGKDHVVPAVVSRENAFKYNTPSTTDYREFTDRTHFIVGQEGWEEVADFCLQWAVEQSDIMQAEAVIH